jgi:ferredoxin-NADP reductase
MDHLAIVVTDRRDEAPDIVSLTLAGAVGEQLPVWLPGAHIEVILPSGLIRHYSLCGDPAERTQYRIAVLREVQSRGGSQEVHDSVQVGTRLQVRSIRNHFELVDAPAYLFIAGGIGITPLLPMLAEVEATQRTWRLIYGGRRRASMAFVDEVRARTGGAVDLLPEDEVGRPNLVELLALVPADGVVYACGPEGLLRAIEDEAALMGIRDVVYLERFTAGTDADWRDSADSADLGDSGDSEQFEVELARSGKSFVVPSGKSILAAVREAGTEVASSCEEGICGTCETTVLDGVPDHHDQVLSESERTAGKTMMICVGRSKTPKLVLDL